MYQMLIGNYEERHRELVLENTELRDCLLAMQRELSALLKKTAESSSLSQSEVRERQRQRERWEGGIVCECICVCLLGVCVCVCECACMLY